MNCEDNINEMADTYSMWPYAVEYIQIKLYYHHVRDITLRFGHCYEQYRPIASK